MKRRAPSLLAVGLALVAVIGIVSAFTPALGGRVELMNPIVPGAERGIATAVVLALSVALLVLSGALRRRKLRAWQASVVILAVIAGIHTAKGFDVEEALAALVLLAGLLLFRSAFDIEGDPDTPRTFVRHLLATLFGLVILGLLLIEGQSLLSSGDALPPAKLAHDVVHSAAGLGAAHLQGRGSRAVPRAMVLYTIAAAAWLLFLWLKPRRQFVRQRTEDRRDARRIVEQQGRDTLDYFALRHDKTYFFSPERDAFLAYRVTAGVALISGDPVGPEPAIEPLLIGFLDYAHRHGWRVAAIGLPEAHTGVYEQAGLRTVYIGDEAIIDPARFSLDGRAIRKVRQSVHRLRRAGYTALVCRRDELSPEQLDGLLRVSRLWLGGQAERGFSMAMDDIWAPEHASALFVIPHDARGRPRGFVHLVPVAQGRGYSLSTMRRLPDTPNGLMEFTLCELFAWGACHGVSCVSLNFNAFGELMRSPSEQLAWWQRLLRAGLSRADRYFQVERLLVFNGKFRPAWQARYAAFEERRDLPLAAIVLLTVESLIQLPRPFRRRSDRPVAALQ